MKVNIRPIAALITLLGSRPAADLEVRLDPSEFRPSRRPIQRGLTYKRQLQKLRRRDNSGLGVKLHAP
jgi:hypothetical protein